MKDLSQARLKQIFTYYPETGIFVWNFDSRSGKRGCRAGSIDCNGYEVITFRGTREYAHRIACCYMTGSWPYSQVDHKDLNRSNNKWRNLRLATVTQNRGNSALRSTNSSGYKGVSYCSDRPNQINRWQAKIKVDYKTVHLGRFPTPEAAAAAYDIAAIEHFGEFAWLNFPQKVAA